MRWSLVKSGAWSAVPSVQYNPRSGEGSPRSGRNCFFFRQCRHILRTGSPGPASRVQSAPNAEHQIGRRCFVGCRACILISSARGKGPRRGILHNPTQLLDARVGEAVTGHCRSTPSPNQGHLVAPVGCQVTVSRGGWQGDRPPNLGVLRWG